ncbi:3-hydroxyacyl-CoA dehydrogenase [Aminobacter niigataensis]|uniref:3-hydroxyacyl-CoA dehydrogenase n=1 Tax=Aminobacter niigataensis TaxID=83265 RepID=UPI00298EFE27|nr:3-hydroxyacyl-CoA dehydrogenase [Aminobacter niigataensis]
MRSVGIVGAGLIGRSWAVVFARAGWSVNLFDSDRRSLEAAAGAIGKIIEEDGLSEVSGVVRLSASLEDAVDGVCLVQECGPEAADKKRELFAKIDAVASGDVILASSTSTIMPSAFASGLPGRHRCLVAHPVNPPHLIPVVELCGGEWTDFEVISRAGEFYRDVGQVPVVVRREVQGFVLNRLQAALLAEALRLVGDGVISAHDLDRTVSDGLGLRWSFMGPLATIELNAPGGIGDYLQRYGGIFREITAAPPPSSVWDAGNVERVVESWGLPPTPDMITAKSEWRDRRLQALGDHKKQQDPTTNR